MGSLQREATLQRSPCSPACTTKAKAGSKTLPRRGGCMGSLHTMHGGESTCIMCMARPKTHLAVARHMRLITAYDGPRGLLFTVRMQHVAVINLMCVATNLICGNKLTSTLEMSIELWSEIKYTLKCKKPLSMTMCALRLRV